MLGAAATESVTVKDSGGKKKKKDSRLTVYGSNMLIDAQVTESFSTLENLTLFMNSVTAVSYTHLSAESSQILMPLPPPPADALIMTGYPISSAVFLPSKAS